MIKLKPFHYFKPSSLEEALSLLSQYGENARVIAGGTDLLVMMKCRGLLTKYLVDIKGIPGLSSIEKKNDFFEIGSLARINTIAQSDLIKENLFIISQSAETLGSYQIRNRATIGGNICNGSPSADMVPALLCLDASVLISQIGSTRTVPLQYFFTGPGETVLLKNEILTRIIIPEPRGKLGAVYIKHSFRNALDLAIIGVAVKFEVDQGSYSSIRIAIGGVAPTPIRAHNAEEFLEKEGLYDKNINKASEIAADEIFPISDVRASAEYRIGMTKILVKRGLELSLKSSKDLKCGGIL
jgi:carbon-monoxide dehydrogenase medium subunit